MPIAKVNGKEVTFEQGMTVLQVCELAGEEIPRFCYHERLAIAGNCRMCLVEIEGGPPKPAASCAMPAAEGMAVHTNTPRVKKAREGVMEFLLVNHPLDCPICDQGGECDLQDQAMAYGVGKSRLKDTKRAVGEKYMGPLIKTHMTRCIHCTRCIRFATDIAGVEELGAVGRGEHMEIVSYLEKSLTSELSGNVVDLCPVGALTSKPYAYKARPWELVKTESIDVLDAVGSNIRIDSKGKEVMRILPRLNEALNEEWISDKTRYACDGLKVQRLDRPYVKRNGKLVPATFEEAYHNIAEKFRSLDPKNIAAIAGDMADCESLFALKTMLRKLGAVHYDCRQDGAKLDASVRVSYLFNTTVAGIEQADACLLVGTNPRIEAALVNARIRKRYLQNHLPVALAGKEADLNYPYSYLGDSLLLLEEIAKGKQPFSKVLKEAKRPMLIIGGTALACGNSENIFAITRQIAEKYNMVQPDWNGYNILHTAAGRVGGLELGFVPEKGGMATEGIIAGCEKGSIEAVILLGADEIDTHRLKKSFVVYIGHHGDKGAEVADVVFPATAYTEKNATYVNMEGRPQQTQVAVFAPGEAKEDWKIIVELARASGVALHYDTLEQLREDMYKAVPRLALLGQVEKAPWVEFGKEGPLQAEPFPVAIQNFYMTDPISRASRIMAQCVKEIAQGKRDKEAV